MTDQRELKDHRIPIMMSETEVGLIDDWSFKHRIRSRGEAIRRLCQIGLMFDNHRVEYVDHILGVFEASQKAIETSPIVRATSFDDKEVDHFNAILGTVLQITRLAVLVRKTAGVANNYKGDEKLEKIMAEAAEILKGSQREIDQ